MMTSIDVRKLRPSLLSGLCLIILAAGARAAVQPQLCSACAGDSEALSQVRADLQEAFRISMEVVDCSGAGNLQSCRRIESLLDETFTRMQTIYDEQTTERECMSCDPRPALSPVITGLGALSDLLAGKGYDDFDPIHRRIRSAVKRWGALACCTGTEPRPRSDRDRDRERDAKTVLVEKCGEGFTKNRRGLRQVLRVPKDRQGCFQSRACRSGGRYQEFATESGFWTYDGEYWYIWKERRQPDGKWVDCSP